MQHATDTWIGQPLTRVEDDRLLRGAGQFVADLRLPGLVHAVFVRSPVARARLRSVDVAAAAALPGVLAVFRADALPLKGTLSVNGAFMELKSFQCPLMARDRLNAVGEVVALVVAESAALALDASELVVIDYDGDEGACVSLTAAACGDSIYPHWVNNEAFQQRLRAGDVDAAFQQAKHVVAVRIDMPRVAPCALETRGALAQWNADERQLTAWLGVQTPHRARTDLASILGLEPERVRVINPDVGGAFGGKASLHPEEVLVAAASMQLGRPVRWIATRNEELTSAAQARGSELAAQAAVAEDGRLLGLRADLRFPLGAWATFSAAVPAANTLRMLPGPYAIPALDVAARAYVTNTAAVGIYRGAGRPDATLLLERLCDAAAAATGLDPAEIRRRNLLAPTDLPCATPAGQRLDSGDYPRLLEHALGLADYSALRREQARRRGAGELVGVGLCVYVEPCGKGLEFTRIVAQPDGRFLVACGTSAQGQGHRTTLAQIAAQALGVDYSRIDVVEGDTRATADGVGALASRSIAIGGSAVHQAALQLRAQLGTRSAPPAQPVTVELAYHAPHEAWASGAAVASIRIDRETGQLHIERLTWVDDAGRIVNPLLARGQLLGGLAQGIGQALCERIHYDESGQLLTGSLMDYAVLRADQMPSVEILGLPSSTDANALGAKGVGESGCIVAPALLLNAALDALAPLGVAQLSLPLTSDTLWRAIRQAQGN